MEQLSPSASFSPLAPPPPTAPSSRVRALGGAEPGGAVGTGVRAAEHVSASTKHWRRGAKRASCRCAEGRVSGREGGGGAVTRCACGEGSVS